MIYIMRSKGGDLSFGDLDDVKNYFYVDCCLEDDIFLDEDFLKEVDCFNRELMDCETVEGVEEILNRYTDTIFDGTEYKIKIF